MKEEEKKRGVKGATTGVASGVAAIVVFQGRRRGGSSCLLSLNLGFLTRGTKRCHFVVWMLTVLSKKPCQL